MQKICMEQGFSKSCVEAKYFHVTAISIVFYKIFYKHEHIIFLLHFVFTSQMYHFKVKLVFEPVYLQRGCFMFQQQFLICLPQGLSNRYMKDPATNNLMGQYLFHLIQKSFDLCNQQISLTIKNACITSRNDANVYLSM